jgi:small subunit ribosomal protein S16
MAPKIKLQRVGTSKQPKYRVVVQEEHSKLDGDTIDILGIYHPRKTPTLFEVNQDKVLDWIKKGAQPTEKVRILLGKAGILPPVDTSTWHKRKPKGEVKAPEAAAAPAEAPAKAEAKAEVKEAQA